MARYLTFHFLTFSLSHFLIVFFGLWDYETMGLCDVAADIKISREAHLTFHLSPSLYLCLYLFSTTSQSRIFQKSSTDCLRWLR